MELIHDLVSQTEEKVKKIEAQIQQSIANHNTLQGYLIATKEALVAAQAIIDAVAPHSSLSSACHAVADAVDGAAAIVDAVEHMMEG